MNDEFMSRVDDRCKFSFQDAFIDTSANAKSDRNESFQEYKMRIFMHKIIFDIIAKSIIKSIEKNLIISSNINLKIIKLQDINWYKTDLTESIDFASFRLDDIRISIHSRERIWIILKEHKFTWYEYALSIFLNQEFDSEVDIILEIESDIKNFILFNEKEIELREKNMLIMNEINVEFKFIVSKWIRLKNLENLIRELYMRFRNENANNLE